MTYNITKDGELNQIFTAKELSKMVKDTVEYYQNRCEELKVGIKTWRESALARANEELIDTIQSLREQLALSYGQFDSEREKEDYDAFVKQHTLCREGSRINGGKVPYVIPLHTGVGTIKKVVCPVCGKSEDITDMGVW